MDFSRTELALIQLALNEFAEKRSVFKPRDSETHQEASLGSVLTRIHDAKEARRIRDRIQSFLLGR